MKPDDLHPLEPFQWRSSRQASIWDALARLQHAGHSHVEAHDPAGTRTLYSRATGRLSIVEAASNTEYHVSDSQRAKQQGIYTSPGAPLGAAVTRFRPPALYEERFHVLGSFEGTIRELYPDYFIARLDPLSGESRVQEEAEFPNSEVPPADRALITLGAVFYWYLGLEEKAYGQVTRASLIRFKRLPNWDDADFKRAAVRADFLRAVLDLNGADDEA